MEVVLWDPTIMVMWLIHFFHTAAEEETTQEVTVCWNIFRSFRYVPTTHTSHPYCV